VRQGFSGDDEVVVPSGHTCEAHACSMLSGQAMAHIAENPDKKTAALSGRGFYTATS